MRLVVFGLGAAFAFGFVACVGDDPTPAAGPTTDAGPSNVAETGADTGPSSTTDSGADAGPSDGSVGLEAGPLPLIDAFDVMTLQTSNGGLVGCLNSATQAFGLMGGTYLSFKAVHGNARAVERPGAALFTYCNDKDPLAVVDFVAFGIKGALDPQSDNKRLYDLFNGAASSTAVSPPDSKQPVLRTSDGANAPKAGLTSDLCLTRANEAIDAMFATASDNWNQTKGPAVIGGSAGTTVAITCLAVPNTTDVRVLVIRALTIDSTINAPGTLVTAVRAELKKSGAID